MIEVHDSPIYKRFASHELKFIVWVISSLYTALQKTVLKASKAFGQWRPSNCRAADKNVTFATERSDNASPSSVRWYLDFGRKGRRREEQDKCCSPGASPQQPELRRGNAVDGKRANDRERSASPQRRVWRGRMTRWRAGAEKRDEDGGEDTETMTLLEREGKGRKG